MALVGATLVVALVVAVLLSQGKREGCPNQTNHMMINHSIILASASPRRQALLGLLGVPFTVQVADVDEDIITTPNPVQNVLERALLKGRGLQTAVGRDQPTAVIIAADTTVALEGEMLNKPADADEATAMLTRLAGRWHEVHTGMAVLQGEACYSVVDTTAVLMRPYTAAEIATYVATGDPLDKAGAYAIQHPVFAPVAALAGCYLGVVGLSVCRLRPLLAQAGVATVWDEAAITAAHRPFACTVGG